VGISLGLVVLVGAGFATYWIIRNHRRRQLAEVHQRKMVDLSVVASASG
jgi:hypothetical protein